MPAHKKVSKKKTLRKSSSRTYPSQVGYSGGGYGKRPLWQWIVIYLLVAVVIYYLIYYFFINRGNANSSYSSLTTPSQQTQSYNY